MSSARWMALAALVAAGCGQREDAVGTKEQAVTTCTTVQRGTSGSARDAMLSSPPAAANFGGQPIVRVGGKDEGLFWFSLDGVPSNAVVNKATMTLYVSGDPGNAPISVHRANAWWLEPIVSFASFDQQYAFDAAAIINPTSANAFKSVDITALAQAWVSGVQPNNGVLLETSSQKKTIFVSSEGSVVAQRPALQICYTTPDDHCAGDPCLHGGTCANEASGYSCSCAPGYTGTRCETRVSACDTYPCQHGGACTDEGASYACTCPAGYTGTNCENIADNCVTAPCQNGGTCTNGINTYTCACPADYTGTNCETQINDCAGSPCQNGGTCTDGANSYTCSCSPGYTGTNCEILVDNCAPGLCQNGGTCINGVNTYACSCPAGYTGMNCETLIDNCTLDACSGHGTCTNGVGTYACTCDPGYSGDRCDVDIDECASQPCQHGGTCIDGVGTFTCECVQPYSGATCESYPTDPCLFAGGTLVPYVGNYTITNKASVDALFCVSEISGTLTITADATVGALSLPSLRKVAGLRVTSTSVAPSIAIRNLNTVTNLVDVQANPNVTSIDLAGLGAAGGFYVKDNPILATFDAGQVTSTSSVGFINNAKLTTLGSVGLGALTTMTQSLTIQNNPKLASLGANGLSALISADRLVIDNNSTLTSLGNLAALTSLPHGVELIGNPLTAVDLGNVTNVGSLYVENNTGLTTLALGMLPATMSYFDIKSQPLLDIDSSSLANLQTIQIDTYIDRTGIRNVTFAALTNVGRTIDVGDNAQLATVSMPSLTTHGVAFPGGTVSVYRNPVLTTVSAPNAVYGGIVVDSNASLTSFRYDHLLSKVPYANLTTNPLLSDIGPNGLSGVQQVVIDMRVRSVPLLTSLGPTGLTSLVSTGRDLEIQNTRLTSITLPNLTTVGSAPYGGGSLQIWSNPTLATFEAPNATVWGLSIDNNTQLTTVHFAGFQPSVYSVNITRSKALVDITLAAFTTLTAVQVDLNINNTGLPNVPLGAVTTVGRFVQIVDNANMTAVDLSHLVSVGLAYGGALYVQSNPNVTSIDASAATQLAGFIITDDPKLTSFHFAGTTDDVAYAVLRNVPMLSDIGTVGFSTVRSVRVDLEISATGLSSLGAMGLNNLVTAGRSLYVTGNPNLTSVSLSSLQTIGTNYPPGDIRVIDNSSLVSFDAPNATIPSFYIFNDPQLQRFTYAHIKPDIEYAILRYLSNLSEIGSTGLSDIRTIHQYVLIEGTGLTTFGPRGLSDLVSTGAGIRISYCPNITSLGPTSLGSLRSLGATYSGGLELFWMTSLQSFNAPLLTSLSSRLYVDNNSALTTLGLPSLTQIGSTVQVTNNTSLPACAVSQLLSQTTYVGTPTVYNNGPACN